MISAGEFRNGVTFEMDGQVMQVIEFQHVKPGKGSPFVRTKMKNVMTGAVIETSFNPTAKFESAYVERKNMEFSYSDGDLYYFMDPETYELVPIDKNELSDGFRFVKENKNQFDANATLDNAPFRFNPPAGTVWYKEGDEFQVGSLTFRVLETPGHTPGGVCLLCGDALFTGDTLFRDSCGRTDLPGGDMPTLLRSLKKLGDLPGDYEVYPGHMDSTTLDRERRFNYYMKYACETIP